MKFDVAILGSGPSACALAIRGCQAGMRIALIGRISAKNYSKTPETVPALANAHFEELGLAESMPQFVLGKQYLMSSAWGTNHLSTRYAIHDATGPGFLINRVEFDSCMLSTAQRLPGVSVKAGTIQQLKRVKDVWDIKMTPTSECIRADVVVDASGRCSALARLLGVKRLVVDVQVCVEVPAILRACPGMLVESTSDGWWFSAPTREGGFGVTWFTDVHLIREALKSKANFMSHLTLAQHTSAAIESVVYTERKVRLAGTSILSRFAGDGWLAIGDAAIAPDPLSSQGVITALESSRAALAAIQARLSGIASGMDEYAKFQRDAARRLIRQRQVLYDNEKRWRFSSFWRHRSTSLPVFAV